MSDYMGDISDVLNLNQAAAKRAKHSTNDKAGYGLEMDDFLKLMVATLQNQSIDETADTSDMLNQMVQMSVITAINNISSLVSESTTLNYAASLVGKEVTIGYYDGNVLKEVVGTVTGTGTLNGQQVIFIGDDIYYLSQIMAVGRLPASDEEKAAGGGAGDGTGNTGNGTGSGAGSGTGGVGDDYREEDVDGDGIPEKVYPGPDGEFDTADDYYEKDVDGVPEQVQRGEDGKFGVKDPAPNPDPNLDPKE